MRRRSVVKRPQLSRSDLEAAVRRTIWETDLSTLPWWKAWTIASARVVYAVVRDLSAGQLTMRAMSLVYTTLLSMVPLLAISFSVLKAFGVHNKIEPFLLNFLAPLGEKGAEITNRIIGFVENVDVGVLGAMGLALLLYTVVALMQKIERAFNYTWRVPHDRPLGQRFSGYLSVLVIGPVLIFSSLGVTATLTGTGLLDTLAGIEPFGALIKFVSRLIPYAIVIGAFTFIYIFMPNTKVRLRSAFIGALVAGVLWETTGWVFASFVVGSTKYTAIYSAFATLIMFMIWLYLSWLILLIGANIAFYDQYPEYLAVGRRELHLSSRVKEKLALLVMHFIGENLYHERPPWTAEGLAQRLRVPKTAMDEVLDALVRRGLLGATSDSPAAYLPARPLETTAVKEVLDAVRSAEEESYLKLPQLPAEPAVEDTLRRLDRAMDEALSTLTVKDVSRAAAPRVSLAAEPPAE